MLKHLLVKYVLRKFSKNHVSIIDALMKKIIYNLEKILFYCFSDRKIENVIRICIILICKRIEERE